MSAEIESEQWGIDEWKEWASTGRRNVTFVGMLGKSRIRARLLSVSKSGLRVRCDGNVERWHPDDVRPGWL